MKFIEDQLRRACNLAAEAGLHWSVTLESKRDPKKWVEVTCYLVNLHYPHQEDPTTMLTSLSWPLDPLEIDSWEANKFVTVFWYGAEEQIRDVAAFIARYIESVLQESADAREWTISERDVS